MNHFKMTALAIAGAATLLLGVTESALAASAAVRCAASLERLDKKLDSCGKRCLDGKGGQMDVCAARCEDTFDIQRDRLLGRAGCESLSQMMQARIGTGGAGGSALWCACKLNCDNDYAGMPVLIKACKSQCDANNKCRTGAGGIGGGGIFIR